MPELNADQMNAVTLKLPEFWQANPAGWFRTVESQFTLRGITVDDTKFHYVVASLGSSTSAELEGFLNTPLAANKYEAIKKELLKIYQLTPQAKKRLLMNLPDLGDRKPTEMLRYMKTLHQTAKDDVLFMVIFTSKLPASVRPILAAMECDDIDVLAARADEVMAEQTSQSTQAAATLMPISRSGPSSSKVSQSKPKSDGVCRYHKRWGKDANRCLKPCTWSGNAPASH